MSDPRYRSDSKAFGNQMFDRTEKTSKFEDWAKGERHPDRVALRKPVLPGRIVVELLRVQSKCCPALPGLMHDRSARPLRGSRCRHEVGFAHDTLDRPCRCLDPVEWLVIRSGGQKAQDLVDPGILEGVPLAAQAGRSQICGSWHLFLI